MRFGLPACLLAFASLLGAQGEPPAATLEPTEALIEAFRTHDVVAVTDPHGNDQVQMLLLTLVRDRRFPQVANDIVIETASSRFQDVLDRFVRGEDIAPNALRKIWEEHTVSNSLGIQAEALVRAVRMVNASLSPDKQLRVLAGDPPIDWDNVVTPADHQRWINLRDSYPADLIRHQVLERGRRALLVYGQAHLQRQQIATNYDMSSWQAQTVVSLLLRDSGARVFSAWTLLDAAGSPTGISGWPTPSLALTKDTWLGALDFGTYSQLLGGARFGLRNGGLVPLARDEWKILPMSDQFDAVLYLGPAASLTSAPLPATLCQDASFVARRLERLTRFGPPVEVQAFKRACAIP
jgi:hypothetical protein